MSIGNIPIINKSQKKEVEVKQYKTIDEFKPEDWKKVEESK